MLHWSNLAVFVQTKKGSEEKIHTGQRRSQSIRLEVFYLQHLINYRNR